MALCSLLVVSVPVHSLLLLLQLFAALFSSASPHLPSLSPSLAVASVAIAGVYKPKQIRAANCNITFRFAKCFCCWGCLATFMIYVQFLVLLVLRLVLRKWQWQITAPSALLMESTASPLQTSHSFRDQLSIFFVSMCLAQVSLQVLSLWSQQHFHNWQNQHLCHPMFC